MKQMPVLSGLSNTGKPGRMRTPAHLGLAHFADRKQGVRERRRRDPVQKIALILGAIRRFQQLQAVRRARSRA